MTDFNRETVLATLEAVVADAGEDFVYPMANSECMYSASDGSPSCLVGYVIDRLAPETFARIVELEAEQGVSDSAASVVQGEWNQWEEPGDVLTQDYVLARALGEAQNVQDSGDSWGMALKRFKNVLDNPNEY